MNTTKINPTTEQVILETAERLFLEKGFALTSTTEIAKKAGCNQALVHYYFRTKENLFQQIFMQKVQLFASTFLSIDDEDLPFEEKLQRKIEAHFDLLSANPKLPFLLLNEVFTNPERLMQIKEKIELLPLMMLNRLDRELREEIDKGQIRPISTIDLIINVLSLNIFLFLSRPILSVLLNSPEENWPELEKHRKQEIVTTILNSLRP